MTIKYQFDNDHSPETMGFDISAFDTITEQEIREYFTPDNWYYMHGTEYDDAGYPIDWNDAINFESFINGTIAECIENGKLIN